MARKKTNYTPYLIGAGAIGLIAFLFKDDLKNLFKRSNVPTDETELIPNQTPVQIPEKTSGGGGGNGSGTGNAITKGLNPIGTPKEKINMDIYLTEGMRGQEVAKLQQLLNRISKITGKPAVEETGYFGAGTKTRLSQTFGDISQINLFKMYVALFAVFAASQGKQLKKWFDVYQTYLASPQLRQAGRTQYFKSNTVV